jgi:hypothetical protein
MGVCQALRCYIGNDALARSVTLRKNCRYARKRPKHDKPPSVTNTVRTGRETLEPLQEKRSTWPRGQAISLSKSEVKPDTANRCYSAIPVVTTRQKIWQRMRSTFVSCREKEASHVRPMYHLAPKRASTFPSTHAQPNTHKSLETNHKRTEGPQQVPPHR